MYAMFLSIRTPECPLFAHQLGIFIDATFSDRQEPEVLIQSEADPDTTGSVAAKQIHGIVLPKE